MTSLMFLIYLSAMGVFLVLERQGKRQKREIALECARLGLPLPSPRPKIQTLEALLNIAIGVVMILPAASGFWMMFQSPLLMAQSGPGAADFFSVLLAAGLTLIFLGSKALRQNLIHRRNASQRVRRDRGSDRVQ